MKQIGVVLACLLMLFLIGSCADDPPQAPVMSDAAALAKGPPSGGEDATGNNLSFPVIAVDGFDGVADVGESFTVPYTGTYPGLTADEIAYLVANGPWYAQKTDGNTWNAEYLIASNQVDVTGVDWGDNIESVNPKLRRPFRIEVRLFKDVTTTPMTAYTMGELEFPSSSRELQGTNTTTYLSDWAMVISRLPKFVIQFLGNEVPADISWAGTQWTSPTTTFRTIPMAFGPELNVGGKWIWGGSQGGWKPDAVGMYRLTFYIPTGNIKLAGAVVGNYPPPPLTESYSTESDEGGVATPVVDAANNLTYVDVKVVSGGGGSRP